MKTKIKSGTFFKFNNGYYYFVLNSQEIICFSPTVLYLYFQVQTKINCAGQLYDTQSWFDEYHKNFLEFFYV